MKILDFGAGTGNFKTLIEYYIHGVHFKLLDKEPRGEGITRFHYHSLETKLPYETEDFDIVTALSVVQYVKDLNGLFSEFYRVLKPNGKLYIIHPAFFSTHGKASWYCDDALYDNAFTVLEKSKVGGRFFGYWFIEAVKNTNHASAVFNLPKKGQYDMIT